MLQQIKKELLKLGKQNDLSIFTGTMVEMTWTEVKKSAENGDVVLFPVGIIEEHGPHMDLSPDVYMAYLFCRFLKQSLERKNIRSIIAPPYYWGISEDVKNYPGTFSVRPETFKSMLIDIFNSLSSWGFTKVFIINSHGDHTHVNVIEQAVKEMRDNKNMKIYNLGSLNIDVENPPVFPLPRDGKFEPDFHAGANETAAMYTFYPQKVNVELAKELKPQNSFHPLGYCGDPASFSMERTVIEYYKADLEMDTLKIEAVLKKKEEINKNHGGEAIHIEPMSDFFTVRVEGYEDHMLNNVGNKEGYTKLAELLPQKVGELLDLGCGTGLEHDDIFKTRPFIKVTGIDLTQAMLDKLKQKHPKENLTLINASYFDYDLGIEQYNAAISFQTMHHFLHEDKIRLYSKVCAALKSGGQYIESDYMVTSQADEDFFYSENQRIRNEQGIPDGEFYHYDTPCTVDNQIAMLYKAGFSTVKMVWRVGNTTIIVAQK
jgi:creatinine amidohydrolase/Fe(II)-dependent formamide hydrolase-like protein/SAM-dependent methyltransferase